MTNISLNEDIVADIIRVAQTLGVSTLSREVYLEHGSYSKYKIQEGGTNWEDYRNAAGLGKSKFILVEDEVYFDHLKQAYKELGRPPKYSERKKFGLTFHDSRYSSYTGFIEKARELGIIPPAEENVDAAKSERPKIVSRTPPQLAIKNSRLQPRKQLPIQSSNRVFIVHGRDNASKFEVARFLSQLDLEPIILAEQPNQGRTIIEKLEDSRDVGFAVVLLTPDDSGSLKSDIANLQPRARQNVILELGYFFGRLGRDHVCALIKDDVEKPSDILGIVWLDFDDRGAWKLALAQEMRAAGLKIDLNKLNR